MKISTQLDATIRTYAESGFDGRNWYFDSHSMIMDAADTLKLPAIDLFASLAIYSPRIPVRRSIPQAVNALLIGESGGMTQRDRAIERYFAYGIRGISGPKVTPFFANLIDPSEKSIGYDQVTVDVWISRAYGVDFDRIKVGERRAIQEHVRGLAKIVGEHPNQTQAAIWRGFRLSEGVDDYAPLDVLAEFEGELLICS